MLMLVLRCMGSMQMRNAPFFFCTTTIELIQDVGFITGTTMSCWTIPSKVSLRCFLKATGTRLGPCFTVSIFRSSRMLYSPSYWPIPCGRPGILLDKQLLWYRAFPTENVYCWVIHIGLVQLIIIHYPDTTQSSCQGNLSYPTVVEYESSQLACNLVGITRLTHLAYW